MSNLKFSILLVSIFILNSCGESTGVPVEKPEPVKVIKTTPELSAVHENFSDIEYLFTTKNDTTYIINFWATWCAPCVAELPYFEYANKTYLDQKLKVVLISLDFKKQIESKLKPFIQKQKLMSEVIALTDNDYNTWIDKVNPEWDGAIPATIIHNADNYHFHLGEYDSYNQLDSVIQFFIKN